MSDEDVFESLMEQIGHLAPDNVTILTLRDERERLGASITLDEEAVTHCLMDTELLPSALHIRLVLPTPQQVEQCWPGTYEWDWENGAVTIDLACSDRPEFSEKSLLRLSRSLVCLLRSSATLQTFVMHFGLQEGHAVYLASGPLVEALAYRYAKTWALSHDGMRLVKQVAEEPVPDH